MGYIESQGTVQQDGEVGANKYEAAGTALDYPLPFQK
jgi:hypothetical protein